MGSSEGHESGALTERFAISTDPGVLGEAGVPKSGKCDGDGNVCEGCGEGVVEESEAGVVLVWCVFEVGVVLVSVHVDGVEAGDYEEEFWV